MNKKILITACLVIMITIFSSYILLGGDKKQTTSPKTTNGSIENIENEADRKTADDNVDNNAVWPSNIPDFVPEFTHGDLDRINVNKEDNSQWIIDYVNVPDDVMEKYAADLEIKGWETSIFRNEYGNSLAASHGVEEHEMGLSHVEEAQTAQLCIIDGWDRD